MEVRIIITDSAAGNSAPASSTTTENGAAAAPAQPTATATPPADFVRAALATGALDAGPAPSFIGQGGAGAPSPFVTGAATAVGSAALPTPPGPALPAGAAPGAGSMQETFEAEDPGEEE